MHRWRRLLILIFVRRDIAVIHLDFFNDRFFEHVHWGSLLRIFQSFLRLWSWLWVILRAVSILIRLKSTISTPVHQRLAPRPLSELTIRLFFGSNLAERSDLLILFVFLLCLAREDAWGLSWLDTFAIDRPFAKVILWFIVNAHLVHIRLPVSKTRSLRISSLSSLLIIALLGFYRFVRHFAHVRVLDLLFPVVGVGFLHLFALKADFRPGIVDLNRDFFFTEDFIDVDGLIQVIYSISIL